MSKNRRSTFAIAAAVLAVGAGVVAIPQAATAATSPPWQTPTKTDPNNVGTITFYDATGAAVTSGDATDSLGAYVGTTGLTPLSGNTKAVLYAYTPNSASAPGAWSGQALTGATTWPNSSAPAPLKTDTHPLVTESSGDTTLDDFATNSFPNNDSTAGYEDVYELRVFDTGTGGLNTKYASADVLYDSAAHTWTQVWPTAAVTTAPGAPTSVTATAGDASATVSWHAPASGGASITKYTVSYTPSGGSATTKDVTGATTTNLTGLTNGTTYSITVTATNNIGTSSPSTAVQVTPKTASSIALSATPASVTSGKTVAISGTLTAATIDAQTVTLTITQAGQSPTDVPLVTDATGAFSTTFKATYNTTVLATYAGTATGASATATKSVSVATVVTIKKPKANLKTTKRTLKVKGTTSPHAAGAKVTLYRVKGSKLVKLATGKVKANGKFAIKYTFAKGKYKLEVKVAATSTNAAGVSKVTKITQK